MSDGHNTGNAASEMRPTRLRDALRQAVASVVASARIDEAGSFDDLTAMLDGIHGDLAWLLAKLERPAEAVLHAVTRAKRYRAHPSLLALRMRANWGVDAEALQRSGQSIEEHEVELVVGRPERELVPVSRRARVFSHGALTRYPFQGALYGLPSKVMTRAVRVSGS